MYPVLFITLCSSPKTLQTFFSDSRQSIEARISFCSVLCLSLCPQNWLKKNDFEASLQQHLWVYNEYSNPALLNQQIPGLLYHRVSTLIPTFLDFHKTCYKYKQVNMDCYLKKAKQTKVLITASSELTRCPNLCLFIERHKPFS